jgi:MoaA/NifB/PqqE/SkfB family radical SAM enzyme
MTPRGFLLSKILSRWPNPSMSKVNLYLTSRCNHRCVTCDIWQHPDKQELTIEDIDKIILVNPSLMWASLTGGEPVLNHDFENILYECVRKLPLTNIISNGQLPIKLCLAVNNVLSTTPANHILIVHLSLFGEQLIHDEMAGVIGSYEKVIETMRLLKSLGYKNRMVLGFEHLISHHNPGMYAFVQYKANQMGVGITYTLEQQAGYYQNVNNVQKLEIPKISLTLNPIDQFKNTFLLNSKRKAGCVAGEYSCWVMPDKTVYPCLFSIPKYPTINLLDTDYKLSGKLSREYVKNCKGCWTPCESYTMMAFRPWRIFEKIL